MVQLSKRASQEVELKDTKQEVPQLKPVACLIKGYRYLFTWNTSVFHEFTDQQNSKEKRVYGLSMLKR